jgi:hypothetical protein
MNFIVLILGMIVFVLSTQPSSALDQFSKERSISSLQIPVATTAVSMAAQTSLMETMLASSGDRLRQRHLVTPKTIILK